MSRLTRDEYGLRLAWAASGRADCTRRMVGAAIVAQDGTVLGTGYNGLAAGRPGCESAGACPRGQMVYETTTWGDPDHPVRVDIISAQKVWPKDVGYEETGCRAVHAEVNAIIRVGRDRCIGSTIYVTDRPCFGCSVVIEGAGLVRVVTPDFAWAVDTWSER